MALGAWEIAPKGGRGGGGMSHYRPLSRPSSRPSLGTDGLQGFEKLGSQVQEPILFVFYRMLRCGKHFSEINSYRTCVCTK